MQKLLQYKEALYYNKLDSKLRCKICARYCLIDEGKYGFCTVRKNENGKLYLLNYGLVSAIHLAPSELKPIFHFKPGKIWLSVGTYGCNFRCRGCQNWDIAHFRFSKEKPLGEIIMPEELVDIAIKENCTGLSFTYNEPTVWYEYTLDCMELAKERGLHTNYVTNGFMTPEVLKSLKGLLDVFRVDIKGKEKFYSKLCHLKNYDVVYKNAILAKELGMHVEVVTNITPGYNDDTDTLHYIARFIKNELGEDTPWHCTRFVPHLYLSHLPATPEHLKKHIK